MRHVAGGLAAIVLLVGLFAAAAMPAPAAERALAAAAPANPPEVQQLLTLLADPKVQEWLKQQNEAKATAAAQVAAGSSLSHALEINLAAIHAHLLALARTIPDMPNQFLQGRARVTGELGENGRVKALLLLAFFVGLGGAFEWLFRRSMSGLRGRLDALPTETVRERLHLIALRLALAVGAVAAFALGSVGPFLAVDWPPLLREMLFGYLAAFLILRVANVIGHFLLAPHHERFRIIPLDNTAARFWQRRLTLLVGWLAFGWVTVGFGVTLGYSLEGRRLTAYAFGLVLLGIGLAAVWRRPVAPSVPAAAEEAPRPATHRFGRGAANAALSLGLVLLWVLWVIHATVSLWIVMVAILLPLSIRITRIAVENVLRPPGSPQAAAGPPSVLAVCLHRGVRAALIIGAVALLAWGWGVDLAHFRGEETLVERLANGLLSTVVIVLIADLLWQAVKAAIDRKLTEAAEFGQPNTAEARHRARLRTLLPIFRNILFIIVVAIAAMMALAALGVQIGPLIAGAGVVGVAIGFGAQTFVRDVIAGMFYLMDDAFRVGEYIQAGNYKGTVEGFSIRSVKLRHHRGPVYTVPFSLLGAVQNQSRDWVIDKMTIGITYDSDLERARKLIKQIGLELKNNPDFAPLIIEPLKMQGVEQLGDYAVQIRMKMMTLPGEQFVIRRKAYAMIKKAFDENGIKFAFPTVQVASGEREADVTAAAQRGLELTRPAAE